MPSLTPPPNRLGLFCKQSLRDAIEQQMQMASELIKLDAQQFRKGSPVRIGRLDDQRIPKAMSHRIVVLLTLRMGRHVEDDHVPPELVSTVSYRLSFLVHSSGPIFTRADRVVESNNVDLHQAEVLSDGWDLISEDGDLDKLAGVYWPDLGAQLARDFCCIVPPVFADKFLDGDLTATVGIDPAYWVSAECRPVARAAA
jgi:hypothetical protein